MQLYGMSLLTPAAHPILARHRTADRKPLYSNAGGAELHIFRADCTNSDQPRAGNLGYFVPDAGKLMISGAAAVARGWHKNC
jgi:hypothetical protein